MGNRTVQQKGGALTSYTYDAANQLVTSVSAAGTTTYTYDQAGNLTLVHAPGNVRTSYSWDDENRNTKLIIPGGAITTMAYRHDGLRVRKQTAAGTTKFIYDGQNYLLETDASDTINRVLTSEPMAYGNLVSQRVKSGAVWTPYYHHFDALGSTRQMTGSAGSVVNSYGYTAWGEAVGALTSESIANFFRWVGMLGYFFDDEADTYYVRARHYDPGTGRWLSQDPIGYSGGVNTYTAYFVPNSVDPSGLAAFPTINPLDPGWNGPLGGNCMRCHIPTNWLDRPVAGTGPARPSPTTQVDPSGFVVWDPQNDSWKKSAKCISMVFVASGALLACNLAVVGGDPRSCAATCCASIASLDYIMNKCLQHKPNPRELEFMKLLDDAKVACAAGMAALFPWGKLLTGPKK